MDIKVLEEGEDGDRIFCPKEIIISVATRYTEISRNYSVHVPEH